MKRSKFSLSHYNLLSCDMGEMIPCSLTEVLPGDAIQQATNIMVRVSPMLAPVMHPVKIRVKHWFVPHRIIWEDFEDFITGGPDGFDSSVFPTLKLQWDGTSVPGSRQSGEVGNLADYLGCPPGINDLEVSALPFRAYAAIWNEHMRDQDLQAELPLSLASGAGDTTTNTSLQNVAWEKDYFTSARPWTQKGPEVTLPLQGSANIIGLGIKTGQATDASGSINLTGGTTSSPAGQWSGTHLRTEEDTANPGFPKIQADMSSVSAANINELRLAFALQRYEEARARYGSRYTEYLRYLNVRSSDARLQRPELLGSGNATIQFSEVLQTAEGSKPVGTLTGHGIGAARSNRYRRYFEEHGYVITMLSVLPRTMYPQALHRTWNRRTKEDFWQKELQHIGQQEVLNKELYAPHSAPDGVFGYQDRYDDYRRVPSRVSGEFRTTDLDFWHMARIFDTEPALNADFVKSNPTKRINAVQTNDVLWVMTQHSIQARRLVAKMGTSFIL